VRALVVGAGVVGLTCAVRLAESGHDVHVLARELPLETTSAVAAAWWYPYRALPYDRVTAWARRTYDVLAGLATDDATGVVMRDSLEVHRRPVDEPWWAQAVPALTRELSLPSGYVNGWRFIAPVIEMPTYLAYLVTRLHEAGGDLTRMALSALPRHGDVVVNCTGLGSRLLAGDHTLQPVRGQVMRLEQVGIERVWLDSDAITYVVPRAGDVVIGGTSDEGSWDLRPNPATAESILRRATELVPELDGARVLGHRVGLRPARDQVRLDLQPRSGAAPVVHCYGHGGAGVTLSWGCADEVAGLVATGVPAA